MGRVLTGFSVNAFGTLKIHGGIEGANVFPLVTWKFLVAWLARKEQRYKAVLI